jgi:glycosyltransferase involved in cell wall biosynthesis
MESLALSFIIPAYNCEKYIEACVDTLLDQDLPKNQYEIVIINDGSTDHTAAILNKLSTENKNIRLVNQVNQGRHAARNTGASLAEGRYIWFIDNDDVISRNCLKSVLKIADGLALDVLAVAPPAPFMPSYVETKVSKVISGKELLRKGIGYWAPWEFLIRRDFYRKNGFQFRLRYFLEDIELLYRVFYRTDRFAELEGGSCYGYLKHPESETCKPWNRNKLIDFANYLNYTSDFIHREIVEEDIKNKFEQTRMTFYLSLLNNWKTIQSEVSLDELLSLVKSRPTQFYGSLIGRTYQKIAVHFPHLFVRLKH